jgi:hypothetical protein
MDDDCDWFEELETHDRKIHTECKRKAEEMAVDTPEAKRHQVAKLVHHVAHPLKLPQPYSRPVKIADLCTLSPPRLVLVAAKEDVTLNTLLPDVVKLIALKCNGKTLKALSCTTKRLHQIIEYDDHLWKLICTRDLPFKQLGYPSIDDLRHDTHRQTPIADWKSLFAIYSNILKSDCITCTGLDHSRKVLQRSFTTALGAAWQNDLDRTVTVLIVGMSGTEKYKFAEKEGGISLVTEDWIKDSFKNRRRMDPKAYEPPMFIGLKFCATQVRPGVRTYIEEEGIRRGGEYTADLRKDHNTHLIAVRPRGQKFEFAHRWNVKVVSPIWFFACVQAQKYVDEHDFVIHNDIPH